MLINIMLSLTLFSFFIYFLCKIFSLSYIFKNNLELDELQLIELFDKTSKWLIVKVSVNATERTWCLRFIFSVVAT